MLKASPTSANPQFLSMEWTTHRSLALYPDELHIPGLSCLYPDGILTPPDTGLVLLFKIGLCKQSPDLPILSEFNTFLQDKRMKNLHHSHILEALPYFAYSGRRPSLSVLRRQLLPGFHTFKSHGVGSRICTAVTAPSPRDGEGRVAFFISYFWAFSERALLEMIW